MADHISFRFPADTGYIGAIRLAVSGIAGMLDFAVDEIEDLKSCVAEACILLLYGQKCDDLKIDVEPEGPDMLRLCVQAERPAPGESGGEYEEFNEEISRLMIEALSENAVFDDRDGILHAVSFDKKHETSGQEQ